MLALILVFTLAWAGGELRFAGAEDGAGLPAGGIAEDGMVRDLAQELAGKWRITAVHQAEAVAEAAPLLDFRPGVVAVFGGCNQFALDPLFNPDGTLSLIRIPGAPLSKVCSAGAMAVEGLVLQALSKLRDVRIEGDLLILSAFGQEFIRAERLR